MTVGRVAVLTKLLLAGSVAVLLETGLLAQSGDDQKKFFDGVGCAPGTNYETQAFQIRSVTVGHPFAFLSGIETSLAKASDAAAELEGKPFRYADVRKVWRDIEDVSWLPANSESRVTVDLAFLWARNCKDKSMDLRWEILTSQLLKVPGATAESSRNEERTPQSAAGAEKTVNRLHVSPVVKFEPTGRISAGESANYRLPAGSFLDSISTSVAQAGRGHDYQIALSGQQDHENHVIARSAWSIAYQDDSTRAFETQLQRQRGLAEYSLITQPLGGILPFRFATALEIGKPQESATVPLEGLDDVRYSSLKLLGGFFWRNNWHLLSASYGTEFGFIVNNGGTWRKHLVDITHEVSLPSLSHRKVQIEGRLTGGSLRVDGAIPAGSRFFGGNREEFFTMDPEWEVRSNPVIRSLPANRLTIAGAGGDRFVSYNLNVSYPLHHLPLVPSELSNDPKFDEALGVAMDAAKEILAAGRLGEDSHIGNAAMLLPGAITVVTDLKKAVETRQADLHPASGTALATAFTDCLKVESTALRRLKSATQGAGADQYGRILNLLSKSATVDGGGVIEATAAGCGDALAAQNVQAPEITELSSELRGFDKSMSAEIAKIDSDKAEKEAENEIRPARVTLNRLTKEVNFFSIGPAFMLDVARLSRAGSSLVRSGVGGGIRFSLVSTVDFTLGYLANTKRQPGEPKGALTFSMQFRDLLD